MAKAFVFPGQGSQYVGMGKDLADNFIEAQHVFDEVDEALGEKLSKIIFDGPEDLLGLTHNTQPALMAVSMAAMAVIEKKTGQKLSDLCSYVAGHSLGEYSALTAAGALSVGDSAKLLKLRGRSMQDAVPVGQGAMVAVLGLEMSDVESVAAEASKNAGDKTCQIANDNSPGQVVLSGHSAAIEQVLVLAKEAGAKRVLALPVSVPAHSILMKPAADKMEAALNAATIHAPSVPVIANVTAAEVTEPDEIRKLLVQQMTGGVRWRESVAKLKDLGVTEMYEVGAGKVLSGLVRRIDTDLSCKAIGTADQVTSFVEEV